jgi:hypothetical protein
MPIKALAVQIWAFCACTSQRSLRRNVPADHSNEGAVYPSIENLTIVWASIGRLFLARGKRQLQRRLGPLVAATGRPTAGWQASLRRPGRAAAICARHGGPGEELLPRQVRERILMPPPAPYVVRLLSLVRLPIRPFTGCTPVSGPVAA